MQTTENVTFVFSQQGVSQIYQSVPYLKCRGILDFVSCQLVASSFQSHPRREEQRACLVANVFSGQCSNKLYLFPEHSRLDWSQ